MIVAGTGHRPLGLGGYGAEHIAPVFKLVYQWLQENQPELVLSGMALGFDTILADAAQILKIPFHAYIPCLEHSSKWPTDSHITYDRLLEKAKRVIFTSYAPYSSTCMQKRNEALVDDCHFLLAYWNGSRGGTKNCIDYAISQKVPMINLFLRKPAEGLEPSTA